MPLKFTVSVQLLTGTERFIYVKTWMLVNYPPEYGELYLVTGAALWNISVISFV